MARDSLKLSSPGILAGIVVAMALIPSHTLQASCVAAGLSTLPPPVACCCSARLFGSGYSYVVTTGCGTAGCWPGYGTSITPRFTGSFWAHEYDFTRSGRTVATVSKKRWSWTDSYGIDIIDNEDDVSILCTVVVIDLVCHDKEDD